MDRKAELGLPNIDFERKRKECEKKLEELLPEFNLERNKLKEEEKEGLDRLIDRLRVSFLGASKDEYGEEKFSILKFKDDKGEEFLIPQASWMSFIKVIAPDIAAEIPKDIIDWKEDTIKNMMPIFLGRTVVPHTHLEEKTAEIGGQLGVIGVVVRVKFSGSGSQES